MNIKLQNEITNKFPNLYAPRTGNLDGLSARAIQRLTSPIYLSVGPGWFQLLMDLSQGLQDLDEDFRVTQVKEKFGGLRFYITAGSDEAHQLIQEAEELSYKTCELCGEPGNLFNDGGWAVVRCPEHVE